MFLAMLVVINSYKQMDGFSRGINLGAFVPQK